MTIILIFEPTLLQSIHLKTIYLWFIFLEINCLLVDGIVIKVTLLYTTSSCSCSCSTFFYFNFFHLLFPFFVQLLKKKIMWIISWFWNLISLFFFLYLAIKKFSTWFVIFPSSYLRYFICFICLLSSAWGKD